MVMPGDNVEITVELIYPVALNVGLRFAIREGCLLYTYCAIYGSMTLLWGSSSSDGR